VHEELPGMYHTEDFTNVLYNDSYYASYNVSNSSPPLALINIGQDAFFTPSTPPPPLTDPRVR
jgi:hypothetical protein